VTQLDGDGVRTLTNEALIPNDGFAQDTTGTTYGRLLSAMRGTIRDGHGSGRRLLPGRVGSFVRKMIAPSSVQEPQLCSSEVFDIYRKPFLL
jgi:hypothetical protein